MERRPDDDDRLDRDLDLGDERPASPEQPEDGGFAEGERQLPDEDRDVLPDFARGIRSTPRRDVKPRYSRGIEDPDNPEDKEEGSFATGSDETQEPHRP
jgi:hypothetical protein